MIAPLAEFVDYDGLRRALNAVRDHRDLSFELMDQITGAPAGYFSKLLGPRPVRRIGLNSLGWALGGLGIKCVLIEDPAALLLIQSRFKSRDVPHLKSVMRSGVTHMIVQHRRMSMIGRKGRKSRWDSMTLKQRTAWGKRMAKSRWKKHKRRARQRAAAHKARLKGASK
jgi:hypothetical protein